MNFFKKHKILTAVILVLFLLIGAVCWFVADKLDRITYDDGRLDDKVVGENIDESSTGMSKTGDGYVSEGGAAASTEETIEEVLTPDQVAGLEATDIVLSDMEIFADSDVFNLLLLGTDERTEEFNENARADAIMLLSIHKENKTIKLVSLERAMGVPILEGMYAGEYDILTHCFRYGGADLMLKEVQHCLRVDVDRYVRLNFDSFEQIINAIGGVDVELTELEAKALNGEVYTNAWTEHEVYPGYNHMDGYDALQYARLRYIDSDWRRIERQRKLIQSVVYAAADSSLLELNEAANTILPLIHTNLTKTEILELIFFAPNLFGIEIDQMTIPQSGTYGTMTGLGGRSLLAVDFETNAQILRNFFYGEQE